MALQLGLDEAALISPREPAEWLGKLRGYSVRLATSPLIGVDTAGLPPPTTNARKSHDPPPSERTAEPRRDRLALSLLPDGAAADHERLAMATNCFGRVGNGGRFGSIWLHDPGTPAHPAADGPADGHRMWLPAVDCGRARPRNRDVHEQPGAENENEVEEP